MTLFHTRLDPDADAGVGVAFTHRTGGVEGGRFGLNLGRTEVEDAAVLAENVRLVRESIGLADIAFVHQVHGTGVWEVERSSIVPLGDQLPVADALVTAERGIALCVRSADCLPALLADARAGVIGAAHAGRIGLAAGILDATVAAMRRLGAEEITAWIGPHICGLCYEVPQSMADDVASVVPGSRATTRQGTPALDLGAGATTRLRSLGCEVVSIAGCTREDDALHSYRRDGGAAGRQGALIWLLG